MELEPLHRQRFLFPGLLHAVHYDVVACTSCGFCFASDIPGQEALDQFYQAAEHHLHTELPPGLARIHADFFQFVCQHAPLTHDASILDIGSGMGHFLSHFQSAGFQRLLGMEPAPAAAELARRIYGLEIRSATVDTFATTETFQLISLCGVLEHIADLRSSLARISAMAADDGLLFIAVPDAASFGDAAPAEPFLEFALEHINFFSAASLDNLLAAHGFERVALTSQHNDFYDNHYLLALYRKSPQATLARQPIQDDTTADSLRRYSALSRQALQPVEAMAAQLEDSGEPVLLWGAGSLTSRLLCDTRLGNANIRGIIDRNRNLQGKNLLGISIAAPESIAAHVGATVFIASTTYAAEIRDTLIRQYDWNGRIITLPSPTTDSP